MAAFSKTEIIGGIRIFGASKFCLLGNVDAVYEPFKLYLQILCWHLFCLTLVAVLQVHFSPTPIFTQKVPKSSYQEDM